MIHQIRALAMFAKVAEAGSFRAAAKSLGVSPSVVSQNLAALEERLGAALIYRSTRALRLTSDGEALLRSAQAMIAEAEEGLERFAKRAQEPVGELRVAAPEALTLSRLVDVVASFSDAHPGVALKLAFTDARVDLVAGGVDLSLRVGALDDSALKARRLAQMPRALVASAALVARRGAPARPSDLADWDLVRFSQHRAPPAVRRGSEPAQHLASRTRLDASSAIGVYRLARAGAGFAVTPRFFATEDLASGDMVELLPGWRLDAVPVYALRPPNAPRTSLATQFVAHFSEIVGDTL